MIIKKYKELREYLEMFKKGNCDLLIVMSRAGLGKTTELKEIMKREDNYVYINTHSTPLKTYLTLYDKKDNLVVFDDISSILRNNIMVSMLKCLSDTSPIKEVYYNTTSKLIGNAPEVFKTTSKVCILLNEFDVHNDTLKPIIDRGFFIEFVPSKEEIIKRIEEISKSQNMVNNEKYVYNFIKEHYRKIENLSLRTYTKAIQLFIDDKKNWKDKFMMMIGFDEKVIEYLKLRELYKSDKERIENYNWSRATYFRIKQEVEDE